ncbi:peptidase family M3-domain-containing protein [Protomyces lactucae-debilis]|uniref:Mitochondrial intermediate peptidase n=1 Tax=Protomyces lactucae-debilis TaxID=2754530 RepID=A0A1Y2FV06_PROLT|nr:peptidase family M3-domain-containing protein [Protomyces lactucae-debilis]ORY87124.1 peptidase family M3-domain-containing protein [Protomyces lactucae-debilis]
MLRPCHVCRQVGAIRSFIKPRRLATAASVTRPLASPPSIADDAALRQAFDIPRQDWRRNLKATIGLTPRTGLFHNAYLKTPAGFPQFATDALHKAQWLAKEISERHATLTPVAVVKALDRLSDTLCAVLDLAELVRNSHPDPAFVQGAEEAYDILHAFMNEMNTHTGLFQAVAHVLEDPDRSAQLGVQERAVAQALLADFLKSGIHLDQHARAQFVTLSSDIARAERQAFMDHAPAATRLELPVSKARGYWPAVNGGLMTPDGRYIKIPIGGWEAEQALRSLELPEARKQLLAAMQTPRPDQIANMDLLFKLRAQLAQLTGSNSFSDSLLSRQMAKSAGKVEAFLINLGNRLQPAARRESRQLQMLKQKRTQVKTLPNLHLWDEEYYGAAHVEQQTLQTAPTHDLSSYLSVGTVMQGLSRLLTHLYGLRLVATDLRPGEGWHPDVRRLDVLCEKRGLIGVLYCDLFSRQGKQQGQAAHFTVRCGRKVAEQDLLPGELELPDGRLCGTFDGITYQLPVISLQCDFGTLSSTSFPTLTLGEVLTLFHEMGHAVHSMLGTTDFQTVSGTRVAADFVELPSQIMESFCESAHAWPLFARHYSTDAPVPAELMQRAIRNNQHLHATQAYRQFFRALLDQKYHSALATQQDFSSTSILRQLHRDWALSDPEDTVNAWHVQFTHLAGYGGTYYAYIFDKAIADRIWDRNFARDPLSRRAGEQFSQGLLAHGGAKDAWQCVADVLEQPELALGGEEAMAEVGRWISA